MSYKRVSFTTKLKKKILNFIFNFVISKEQVPQILLAELKNISFASQNTTSLPKEIIKVSKSCKTKVEYKQFEKYINIIDSIIYLGLPFALLMMSSTCLLSTIFKSRRKMVRNRKQSTFVLKSLPETSTSLIAAPALLKSGSNLGRANFLLRKKVKY
jgi:hypothetical protein